MTMENVDDVVCHQMVDQIMWVLFPHLNVMPLALGEPESLTSGSESLTVGPCCVLYFAGRFLISSAFAVLMNVRF